MTFYGPQSCSLGGQGHSNDFPWASKLQFASLQRIQTSKIPNTFPNMHPRAKATSPTGTPGPGHSNGFLWAFKAGFLRLSKLPFASPQTLQNSPNPPNTFPNMHPRAKATSPTGTPGPGHSNGFLWAFKAAVCQPAKAPIPSKIPNPQGQGHSNETFYGLSKLPFASPQRLQTFQNKIPNTFPNRHPRAKATSPTGTPGPGPRPLPQQAPQGQATAMLSMGFQSCRLPARKPSNPLQNSKPPGPGPQQ